MATFAIGAAAPAGAVSDQRTYITSTFSQGNSSVTIAKGQSVTVYGHLENASFSGLSGYVVSLYARTDASKPWTNIRGIVSDENGIVSQKVTPNYNTQLQWRFSGAGLLDASTSQVLNITLGVPPTVMGAWDSAAPDFSSLYVPKGSTTTFTGYLRDLQFFYRIPGATVVLYARANATKPWTALKTAVTDSDGQMTQSITPHYNVQLRWGYAGSAVHGPSTSGVITLVMGAPGTVISITNSVSITKSGSTTVGGHLYTWQNPGGEAPGQRLDLYASTDADATWVKIKSLVVGAEGKVSQIVTPNYTVDLEWRYAGSPSYGPSTSRIITITVKPAA